MPEGFVTLAALVRAPAVRPVAGTSALDAAAIAASARAAAAAEALAAPLGAVPAPPAASDARPPALDFAHAGVVSELVLLRLAAAEAYERAVPALLESLAAEVLARELALAPADVAALARAVLAAFESCEPVAIAVSPSDAERVLAPLPMRIDPSLAAGDLVVDVRDGALESRFRLRLADAVDRAASRSSR